MMMWLGGSRGWFGYPPPPPPQFGETYASFFIHYNSLHIELTIIEYNNKCVICHYL